MGGRPSWLIPQVFGNGIQYEFTAGPKYWLGSGLTAESNVLETVRASDALFDNAAGVYSTFGTDVPAITDRGLYAGGQRTNLFLNNTAPVTQTITLSATGNYTLSVHGSGSVAVAANTATITGAGTASDGTDVTINCTATGTVDCTVTGTPDYVQLEAGAFASPPIVTAGSAATRAADAITNPNFSTHAATFGFASGMAALARVNLTRLSDGADRTILHLGDATEYARLDFTTANKFRLTVRKLGPELVPTTYGGSVSGSWLIASDAVTRNGSATGQAGLGLSSAISASKTYAISFDVANLSGDTFGFRVGGGAATQVTSNGPQVFILAGGGTSSNIVFIPWEGAVGEATITNISIREVITLTLESGVVGSTGVYDVTVQFKAGDYSLTVSGGITGDTDASAETLPAAIANACYIGAKEDVTLHADSPLERLAIYGV